MDEAAAADVRKAYEVSRWRYVAYADSLRILIDQLLKNVGVTADSVTARAKDVQSLADKLKRRPRYESLADVPDLVGVRVVARYQIDVRVVCELLADEFRVVEDVVHGAEEADAFGYASRHLIVELTEPRSDLPEWHAFRGVHAEIQVRSILQHAWASISHGLDYKSDSAVPQEVRRQLFRVAALLETGDELFDDFRRRVEALRLTYTEDVSKDEWRALPLNLDSLRAAYDRLPLDQAANAAVDAGWQRSTVWRRELDGEADDEREAEISDILEPLVVVCSAAGYKTLDDVASVLEEAATDKDWLTRMAAAGAARAYVPFAIPPDVALLRVISKHPREEVIEAGEHSTILNTLVQAAVDVTVEE